MAKGNIPFVSAPLRNWKSFVPAWLVLPITPFVLLEGANNDRLFLYFWLFAVPLLAAAFWPLARLLARDIINNVDFFIWVVVVPMCVAGAVGYAYQFLKEIL
jgi:hypothetical protein